MLPRVCVYLCLVVATLNILLLNPCRPRHPALQYSGVFSLVCFVQFLSVFISFFMDYPTCPMTRPASFAGEAAFGSGFLLQCSRYLEMQPHLFVTERAKVSFIISLLSGRALQWAEALWTAQSPGIHSLEGFVRHFWDIFGQSTIEGIRCQNEEERPRNPLFTEDTYAYNNIFSVSNF
uniref:DUF4939 domain-containing protein n=1 Tax=Sinocyclocheilus grahami TaxID=75366 RepID=A0A672L0G2_SINGR